MRFRIQDSVRGITVLLVAIVALGAVSSLWLLRSVQAQSARATASRTASRQGLLIAAYLATHPVVRAGSDEADWTELTRLVRSLAMLESGLRYVSLTEAGVTLYHKQIQPLSQGVPLEDLAAVTNALQNLAIDRKLIAVGTNSLPVVTFGINVTEAARPRVLEIALSPDAVARESEPAAHAITAMFRISLITTSIAFTVCGVLVLWMMRREAVRERLRREQEHLAFSGVLANGIVHDFRNPMSAVKLDAQMLAKEAGKEDSQNRARISDLARRIGTTVDRMDQVFREFLYLARPSDELAIRISIGGIVRECGSMLQARFERAGVGLDIQGPERDIYVRGNETALRRALTNVLTNAEQFSPAETRVTVTIGSVDGWARIDVVDQGPGIPKKERDRIFEMFATTRPGGTGLGLFLARTALAKAGGRIQSLPAPERGSCFRIELPEDRGGDA